MPAVRLEDLTPFGRLALKLDSEFAELARVGSQIAGVDLETDGGLDDGIRILNKVAKYGESIAATMQEFAQAMQEARGKAEAATKLVEERAQVIKKRSQEQDALHEKIAKLKDDVKTQGAAIGAVKDPGDKGAIAAELGKLQAPLARFVEEARAIKAQAASSNFRRLERQADSMIDSLQASLRKIDQALGNQ